MNCQDCRSQLLHYKLDSLEPLPRAMLEDHLVACAACRAELAKLEDTVGKVMPSPDPELPAGAIDRLMARVAIAPTPRRAPAPVPEEPRASTPEPDDGPGLLASLIPAAPEAQPSGPWRKWLGALAAAVVAVAGGFYAFEQQREAALYLSVQGGTRFSPGGIAAVRLLATHARDRAPLAGAQLHAELVGPDGTRTELLKGVSGAAGTLDGSVQLPMLKEGRYKLVCEATRGEEKTSVESDITVSQVFRVLLTSDKPTYQPGQTIWARALVREISTGRSAEGREITFTVLDAKGNKVGRSTSKVDSYGVAGFEFPLADEIGLGTWRLQAEVAGASNLLPLSVERYTLPKFSVKVEPERPWYRPGEEVSGTVTSRYFFGKPLANAKVKLSARLAGAVADAATPPPSLTQPASVRRRVGPQLPSREIPSTPVPPVHTLLAESSGKADAQGLWRFNLALPRTMSTQPVELIAEVIDAANERVEHHQPLPLSAEDLKVYAVPEGGAVVPGVESRVYVLVARPNGEPVPDADATLSVYGAQYSAKTGPDGIAVVSVKTPLDGNPELGAYATATTREGVSAQASLSIPARSAIGTVRTEKTVVRAGETLSGEVLLVNGAPGHVLLDLVREGSTIATFALPIGGGKAPFAVQLPKGAAGAVTLFAQLATGGGAPVVAVDEASSFGMSRKVRRWPVEPPAALAPAQKTIFVADPRSLKVSITGDGDTYKPGSEAKLTLRAVGDDGKPAAASVGLAVVDESVFALVDKDLGALQAYFLLGPDYSPGALPLDPVRSLAGGEQSDRGAGMLLTRAAPAPASLGATAIADITQRRERVAEAQSNAKFALVLGILVALILGLIALTPFFLRHPAVRYCTASAVTLAVVLYGSSRGVDTWFTFWVSILPLALVVLVDLARTGPGRRVLTVLAPVGLCLLAFLVLSDRLRGSNDWSYQAARLDPFADGASPVPPSEFEPYAKDMARRKAIRNFGSSDSAEGGGFALGARAPSAAPAAPAMVEKKAESAMRTASLGAAPQPAAKGAPAPDEPPAIDKAAITVRSWFPETMFWSPGIITGADGLGTVTVPLADSITTWRMSAVGSAADGRLGAGRGSLRVFQDFFVDLDLPVALTVGDEVEVRIAVHNYLAEPQKVRLEVEAGAWFDSLTPRERVLELKANEVRGVPLRIKATKFGDQTLTVWAAGTKLKDAIRRTIEVRPDGVKVESVSGGLLAERAQASARVPTAAIAGSERVYLRLYPGAVGTALDGIEGVLSQPHGCFEQTSATTYPNVLVLRYLRDAGKSRPEIEAKALGYIQQGYQRLLSFEIPGGGFEWFGRPPANRVLTAFGLLEFEDMKKVYPAVDEAMIDRTRAWLLSQQRGDGAWEPDGHQAYGVSRDTGRAATTAYVTWALAESGYKGPQLASALDFLARNQAQLSTWGRTLYANALVASGRSSGAVALLAELEKRLAPATATPGGPLYLRADGPTAVYSYGAAADVESTALGALALGRTGKVEPASAASEWLVTQRYPHGAWGSTQGTVLALRALLELAGHAKDATADMEIKVRVAGNVLETWKVGASNSDLVRSLELTSQLRNGALDVELVRSGPGARPSYALVTTAFVPSPPQQDELLLAVSYDRNKLEPEEKLGVKARLTWKKPEVPGMVMASLPVPPGFQPDPESLNALVSAHKVGRWAHGRRELTFYLDGLATNQATELDFDLVAQHPAKVRAPAGQAWLYYRPEIRAQSRSAFLEIEPPKVAENEEQPVP